MSKKIDHGGKIEYQLFDAKGKGHWFKGKIHGIRSYEDPNTNAVLNQTYLVDTGREHPDHVGREDRQPELLELPPDRVRPV